MLNGEKSQNPGSDAASERKARAEVEMSAAVVERVGNLEVKLDNRERHEQPAAGAAIHLLISDLRAVGRDRPAVEEGVEPEAAAAQRGRERRAQLGAPDEPRVAGEPAGVE